MIGYYDYTVILTYLSVCSGITGMAFAFTHHPFLAIVCLMVSGLCDMFDGKVARTKKRDQKRIQYGIQIDSLADIISFGVLPIIIGLSIGMTNWYYLPVMMLYLLGALIRLAHFNVNEEMVSKTKEGRSKAFIGLPTTAVSLILPLVYAFKRFLCQNVFTYLYAGSLLIISFLFVINYSFIKKPDNSKMILFIIIGVLEILLIMMGYHLWITR